jgi:hypothetical protein
MTSAASNIREPPFPNVPVQAPVHSITVTTTTRRFGQDGQTVNARLWLWPSDGVAFVAAPTGRNKKSKEKN